MKFKDMLLEAFSIKADAMSRTIMEDPLQSFMFRVSIPGLPTGVGFQKVSGLSREVAVVEYLENMYSHAHKLPGRESVSEITMERGAYADDYLQSLYETVFNNNSARFTMVIGIYDRFNNLRREFQLAECWTSKFELADLDATSDDVIIETLTVQFEYFL